MPDPFDSKLVNARDQIFSRIIFKINVLHNIETKCTLTPSFLTDSIFSWPTSCGLIARIPDELQSKTKPLYLHP
jgi:hypothetical protein